jgi:hypothetical protein
VVRLSLSGIGVFHIWESTRMNFGFLFAIQSTGPLDCFRIDTQLLCLGVAPYDAPGCPLRVDDLTGAYISPRNTPEHSDIPSPPPASMLLTLRLLQLFTPSRAPFIGRTFGYSGL